MNSGVKQGCILSPTIFSIFINDLVSSTIALGRGIQIDDFFLSILIFANDITIISDTEVTSGLAWLTKWLVQKVEVTNKPREN